MSFFTVSGLKVGLGLLEVTDTSQPRLAWRFYCELTSRPCLCGHLDGKGKDAFFDQLPQESIESICSFHRVGVGLATEGTHEGPGILNREIAIMLKMVIEPFLAKWEDVIVRWWARHDDGPGDPFRLIEKFPHKDELQRDWTALRAVCRLVAAHVAETFGFSDLVGLESEQRRCQFVEEVREVRGGLGEWS